MVLCFGGPDFDPSSYQSMVGAMNQHPALKCVALDCVVPEDLGPEGCYVSSVECRYLLPGLGDHIAVEHTSDRCNTMRCDAGLC